MKTSSVGMNSLEAIPSTIQTSQGKGKGKGMSNIDLDLYQGKNGYGQNQIQRGGRGPKRRLMALLRRLMRPGRRPKSGQQQGGCLYGQGGSFIQGKGIYK